MEARNLPERDLLDHVEALMCAFDEAWASIAPTIDLASVENARLSLADAIIAHVSKLRTVDLATLKAAALASFRKRQRRSRSSVMFH